MEQFADEELRNSWIRDKEMKVLQFSSDSHPKTPIDVFVTEPFDFEEEYHRALVKPLGKITILIKMKEAAGRKEDQIDIEYLRTLMQEEDE